jgi:hypothetical protein
LAALREAGERYDLIARRNQLLNEMQAYEARCIAFKDSLLNGKLGTLNTEGVEEAEQLLLMGRSLLTRLDRTLTATQHEPMS